MTEFSTLDAAAAPVATAPDGFLVRVLLALGGGSLAVFELEPGQVARAVAHRTVEEIWYVLRGEGERWRRQGGREEIETLAPGTCVTVPLGTEFQVRAGGTETLAAVAVTMPPWPGGDEAVVVSGRWSPTV